MGWVAQQGTPRPNLGTSTLYRLIDKPNEIHMQTKFKLEIHVHPGTSLSL